MTADVGTATTRGTFRGLSPSIYAGPVRYITRKKGKEMSRIKGLALSVGVATLIVVGVACGGGNDEPPASADFDAPPAADPSGTSVAPPAPAGVPTPKETSATDEPAADSTEPPLTSASVAAREMIRCFPTGLVARVGASVGDSWTLAGNIRLQGKIPPPPPE